MSAATSNQLTAVSAVVEVLATLVGICQILGSRHVTETDSPDSGFP
jgi:hypothetical protein